jgi:hypothetical protein
MPCAATLPAMLRDARLEMQNGPEWKPAHIIRGLKSLSVRA